MMKYGNFFHKYSNYYSKIYIYLRPLNYKYFIFAFHCIRMTRRSFKAGLQKQADKKNWIYVDIPFDVHKAFGKKGRIPVKVNIDGACYISSLNPRKNGKHFLYVNMTIRNLIMKNPGDVVNIAIEPDTKERTVEIPKPFLEALQQNPEAFHAYEKYSYSHKKEYIDWIMDAKKGETKLKRIEKAIYVLSQKNKIS